MKKIILLLALLLTNQSFAQTDFDLVKIFDINLNLYENEKIWLKDNTFLVPISFSTATYTLEDGIVINNPNFLPGKNTFKTLIARYDEDAQLVDYFMLNSIGHEMLESITVDENDNIYLAYLVESGYQLDGQTYFENVAESIGKHMIIKISRDKKIEQQTRNVSWVKTFEGGDISIMNLLISNSGDVFITARADQRDIKVDGVLYPNPTPHQSQTALTRMIVGKLNTGGIGMEWLTPSTNVVDEVFSSIFVFGNRGSIITRLDSQNNLYLLGNLHGTKATFGNTTIHKNESITHKLFMVKFNTKGQVLWVKSPTISNNSQSMMFCQFEIDKQDNLFLLDIYHPGHYGSETVDYWGSTYSTDQSGNTLIKMNTDGSVLWMKRPEITTVDYSYAGALSFFKIINGKILAFGLFKGRFDYDDGIVIDTNQEFKWGSLEFNDSGGIDNYYLLDTSLGYYPFYLIHMDSQNRLWFIHKTASILNGNLHIGSLNYNLHQTANRPHKLILYRSTSVTLNNNEFESVDFLLYPNPAQDKIYLKGNDLVDQNYQIFDILGRKISYGKVENNEVDVETLFRGTYILKIFDRNNTLNTKTTKFIKQ